MISFQITSERLERDLSGRSSRQIGRQVVGKWYNSLDIRTEEMVWARGTKDIPISACSLPCEPGMIKKQQGDTCCWVCDQCEAYEFVYDEYTCMDCGPGLWPHPDKRGCYQLPINHIRCVRSAMELRHRRDMSSNNNFKISKNRRVYNRDVAKYE